MTSSINHAELVTAIQELFAQRHYEENPSTRAFFACDRRVFFPAPGLIIRRNDDVARTVLHFPPSLDQLAYLLRTFPHGTNFIEGPQVHIMNDIFSREITAKILPEMLHVLDSKCLASEVSLELMGLHIDTEFQSSSALRADDKYFAHLVVEPPADYEGGETIITHDGLRKMIDFNAARTGTSGGFSNSSNTCASSSSGCSDADIKSDDAIFTTKFWATFSNCQAEVCKITRGCRLRLQYGLAWKGAAPAPFAGKNHELLRSLCIHLSALHDAIKNGDVSCTGATFAFLLGKAQTADFWSQEALKDKEGPGKCLISLLLKVNESLPADKQLAIHIVTVVRSATQQGAAAGRKPRTYDGSFDIDYYYGDEYLKQCRDDDFILEDAVKDVNEIRDDDSDYVGRYPHGLHERDMKYELKGWIDVTTGASKAMQLSSLDTPDKFGLNMSAASKRLHDDSRHASASSAAAPTLSQSDDCEVEFIPGPHKALPHLRFHCSTHLYSKTPKASNLRTCESCFCYVCDVAVSSCVDWRAHCNASSFSERWKKVRDLFGAGRKSGKTNSEIHAGRIKGGAGADSSSALNLPNVMWADPNDSWGDFKQEVTWKAWHDAKKITTYPARDMLVVWPARLEAGLKGLKNSVEKVVAAVKRLTAAPTAASTSTVSGPGGSSSSH